MIKAILEKIRRHREKRTFHEYGYEINKVQLVDEGTIDYARWKHPFYDTDSITQQKVNFYKKYIKPGSLVVDIGAHEGDTTVPMALAAGKEGIVIGLEPNPHVFPVLEANAKLNPDKVKIVPLNFAATAEDGEFTFGSGDASFGNGGIVGFSTNISKNVRYSFNVTGKNLDHYLRNNYKEQLAGLAFIKTDAEGYDKEILKSIRSIIQEFRPVIVSECFKQLNGDERIELYNFFSELNYKVHVLLDFSGTPPLPITMANMNDRKHFDILALPLA